MIKAEQIAFLVKDESRVEECVRSGLGQLLENRWVTIFLLGAKLHDIPSRESLLDRFEMTADLEGEILTDIASVADEWEHINYRPIKEMAEILKTFDLIVTF